MSRRIASRPQRSPRRGSALIMAVLVVLVLTIIGIGIAFLSQTEDSISGNARLSREAFYAAETGLRKGEELMSTVLSDGTVLTTLLSAAGTPLSIPGGGSAAPLTVRSVAYQDIVINPSPGSTDAAAYSIYVRNNIEDPSGAAADSDRIINLVVLGQAVTLDTSVSPPTITRVLSTRILEEQFRLIASAGAGYPQGDINPAGTNAVRVK